MFMFQRDKEMQKWDYQRALLSKRLPPLYQLSHILAAAEEEQVAAKIEYG